MLHRVMWILLFSLFPSFSASAESSAGQLASLQELDRNKIRRIPGETEKETTDWIARLQKSLVQSTKYEALITIAKAHPAAEPCEMVFNISPQGKIANIKWIQNAPSETFSSAIIDLVKSVEPLKDVPLYFPVNHRVAVTVSLQPTFKLITAALPICN